MRSRYGSIGQVVADGYRHVAMVDHQRVLFEGWRQGQQLPGRVVHDRRITFSALDGGQRLLRVEFADVHVKGRVTLSKRGKHRRHKGSDRGGEAGEPKDSLRLGIGASRREQRLNAVEDGWSAGYHHPSSRGEDDPTPDRNEKRGARVALKTLELLRHCRRGESQLLSRGRHRAQTLQRNQGPQGNEIDHVGMLLNNQNNQSLDDAIAVAAGLRHELQH